MLEHCPVTHDRAQRLKNYVENDRNIRVRGVDPVLEKLLSQKERGTYRHDEALDDFRYVAEGGAKNYGKEFGIDWEAWFPLMVRNSVAQAWLDEFEAEWASTG